VLTAMFPGLRDARNSLIAGYLWLIAVYLWLLWLRPSWIDGSTTNPRLRETLVAIGLSGNVVLASVAAYMIGEFLASAASGATFWASRRYIQSLSDRHIPDIPEPRLRYLFRPFSRKSIRRVHSFVSRFAETVEATHLTRSVLGDALFVSPRLIVAQPELYAEYNRFKSESEFRDAILIPLPLCLIGLLANTGANELAWSIAVPVVLVAEISIFMQARRRFLVAHSMVAHFIADGVIGTPALASYAELTPSAIIPQQDTTHDPELPASADVRFPNQTR
jgi:hypothetical protein